MLKNIFTLCNQEVAQKVVEHSEKKEVVENFISSNKRVLPILFFTIGSILITIFIRW